LWSIESDAHLTNWLRQAMTRRCIDHARWRKTHAQQPLEEIHEPSDHRTPPDVLMQREVRRKLMALPDRKRMVVVLRFQEGLELEEIAEVMNMPVNTVKSTLHRALAVLKRKLAVLRNGVSYGAVRG
ncbi:MAG: RNA polymerase sigma factor, partial [Bryobacteraceae bacterium]